MSDKKTLTFAIMDAPLKEDAGERGLEGALLLDGVEPVSAASLPKLLDDYERVWRW